MRPDFVYEDTAYDLGYEASLRIIETLGEGGMGIVHLAEQTTLRRKVAVKTVRDPKAGREMVHRMLQEARVTGGLEHPNIVPIYEQRLDERGLPLLVMKRIEGTPWDELLADAEEVRSRIGGAPTDDAVREWHLRVFMQIAQAVAYAHERGIVHRDLKPENVMIGTFGEVYLLDWGIAVSMREADAGWLPLAREARAAAGTPAYMAPEQLGGEGALIDECTDTFLLGSVLFEIVVGRPPHGGESMGDVIQSILQPVQVPEDVSSELRSILRKALASERADRFASAKELRRAVDGYLRRSAARSLQLRAEQLEAQLERAEGASAEALYNEARFLRRAVLEEHPEMPREPLDRLDARWARRLLLEDDWRGSDRVLSAMNSVPNDLRAAVAEARERAEAQATHDAAIRMGMDRLVDVDLRRRLLIVFAPLWIGIWCAYAYFQDTRIAAVGPVAFMALAMVAVYTRASGMLHHRLNRTMLASILVVLTGTCLLASSAHLVAFPETALNISLMLLWAVVTSVAAAAIDPRSTVAGLVWALLAGVAVIVPSISGWLLVLGNVLMVATFGVVNLLVRRALKGGRRVNRPLHPSEPPSAPGR